MANSPRRKSDNDFAQRLNDLRLKIDQLPAAHRPHLYELADEIAAQRDRLQARKLERHDSYRA